VSKERKPYPDEVPFLDGKEPSADFPYRQLDSDEDLIRECVMQGGDLGKLLEELHAERDAQQQGLAIRRFFNFVRANSKDVVKATCALMWATGAYYDGKTCRQWAMDLGTTPQNFEQLASRICKHCGVKQTRVRNREERP
jgi:hypothetical protein